MSLSQEYKNRTWTDHKGRTVAIYTMSNRWLKNAKNWLRENNPNAVELKWLREEHKRRHNK